MSKLRERIRETARRRSSRGLGFALARDAAPDTPAAMLVVAEVGDAAAASAALEAGARALLFGGAVAAARAVVEAAPGTPVGVRMDAATAADAEALASAGGDFLVFDAAQTAADALLERRLGYALLAPAAASDDELRRLAPLDLDGVLLEVPAAPLTVTQQLELRRIAEFARAPLIVMVAGAVPAATLEVWRDAGAGALLVPAEAAAAVSALVAAARDVRPPRSRDEERAEPLLPTLAAAGHDHDDDEDRR